MDKRFLAILAGIIIILGGIFVFTKSSDDSKNNSSDPGNSAAQATNHVTGQGQSGVTFLEYGDFQCPVCALFYTPVNQAVSKYNKEIFFQFRNLPLVSIHQNAFAAARAAEASGKQDKYWQMYGKLYENQSSWSASSSPLSLFRNYAKEIGLDTAKFEKDYASEEVNDAINADVSAFEATGREQATPSFFIDGKAIENADLTDPNTGIPTVEKISAQIDKAIADKQKSGGN
jgi:protein-disulfide isomerase